MHNIIIALVSMLTLIGCVSNETKNSYDHFHEYDIKNGLFKPIKLENWIVGDSVCLQVFTQSGHFGLKWAPKVGVVFSTADNQKSVDISIIHSNYFNAKGLYLIVQTKDSEDKEFYKASQKIKYQQYVSFVVDIVEQNVIITYDNKQHRLPIDFTPTESRIIVSSIKTNLEYDYGKCKSST